MERIFNIHVIKAVGALHSDFYDSRKLLRSIKNT